MNTATLVVLLIVLTVLGAVIYNFYRKKKRGQSISGCGSCNKDCAYRDL